MKAKTKKEKKNLFIEMKLKKLFKKVNKKGECFLHVDTTKSFPKKKLNFKIAVVPSTEEFKKYLITEEDLGIMTRELPKRKTVSTLQRIVKLMARTHGYKVSYI